MAKTIAVLGATGTQGGGVAKALLKSGEWNVRAITRNTSSTAAKALAASGAELVAANADDVDSLVNAFEGVQAIFAVTNWWEHLFTGNDPHASGRLEEQQAWNIATAASKTPSLQHYIFSTLPSAEKLSGGKFQVPHFDYKAKVDERIRKDLPALAAKTTFLWLGWYPSNMAFFPMAKAIPVPGSETYIFVAPTPASAYMPVAGEVGTNTGVFVSAILANPDKSQGGRYVFVKTETITHGEIMKIWEGVTGKKAQWIPASREVFADMWGVAGAELADQYIWGVEFPDWEVGSAKAVGFVAAEELGVKDGDLVGLKESFGLLKDYLV